MSLSQQQGDLLKRIGQRTKNIVSGYVHECEKLFNFQFNLIHLKLHTSMIQIIIL